MSDIDPITTARELATHANDIQHLQLDIDKMLLRQLSNVISLSLSFVSITTLLFQ